MKITRPKVTLQAVLDGYGESATWGLYLVYETDDLYEHYVELKWPARWPDRVSGRFLESMGFETIWA